CFLCIGSMIKGQRCSHHLMSTLLGRMLTNLQTHAHHAKGVQYATKSLSKGTAKSSRKRSTAHFPPASRSSRLRAGLCLARPGARLDCSDLLGAGGGGLAW